MRLDVRPTQPSPFRHWHLLSRDATSRLAAVRREQSRGHIPPAATATVRSAGVRQFGVRSREAEADGTAHLELARADHLDQVDPAYRRGIDTAGARTQSCRIDDADEKIGKSKSHEWSLTSTGEVGIDVPRSDRPLAALSSASNDSSRSHLWQEGRLDDTPSRQQVTRSRARRRKSSV